MSAAAPLVSIGVPVYNGEQYLREALDSILGQTFTDLELIICDNASTDATEQIAKDYGVRDSRVRYHRNPMNVGPSKNFVRVFRLARGEYFKWLASDDLCGDDFLRRAIDTLERERDAVSCYSHTGIIDERGELVKPDNYLLDLDAPRPSARLRQFLRARRREGYGAHELWGLMRTDVLAQTSVHSTHTQGDWVSLVEMLLRGRLVRLPEIMFFNRTHSGRSTAGTGRPVRRGSKLSQWIGGGPIPPSEWFEPAKTGRIHFPDWDLLAEYTKAIRDAPLAPAERRACYAVVGELWVKRTPKLARDVLIASEQAIRLARRGRAPWQGGVDELV